MTAGYFGKLPARSDFVAKGCPAGFLKAWEPFLMEGLARSRFDLKDAWQEAYMTMPVWRFWLSPPVPGGSFGERVTGALMPCVDKVGREFPLTIVVQLAGNGNECVAPEEWYSSAQAVLLHTLEDGVDLSDFQHAVAGLARPEAAVPLMNSRHSIELNARSDEVHVLRSVFWCKAADVQFAFECSGLPHAEEFQWLLLPEHHPENSSQSEAAGNHDGQFQSEDHRT